MGTGPDHLHCSIFKQTTASSMEMPTASEPFLLVRFLCGFNKENELGCRAETRRL
jgi:hypothetical protein